MLALVQVVVLWTMVTTGQSDLSDFRFASYYQDHMVLQGAPLPVTVWGFSTKVGDKVTVTVNGQSPAVTEVTELDGQGMWFVKLATEAPSSSPNTVVATSSLGSIQLTDVLFGDVWLCSGQSNMQFTMNMVFNASKELQEAANYPHIRVFTVPMIQSATPLSDLAGIEESWSIPSADTVGHGAWTYFSAVCWLYGKYLYETLQRPIGLIDTSWGGTRIETWSTSDVLSKCRNESSMPSEVVQQVEAANAVEVEAANAVEIEADDTDVKGTPQGDSVLWNSMIRPFINMTIYGAIWYQGEANAGAPDLYSCLFPGMITDWRNKFSDGTQGGTDPNFPFGFVQLSANRNDPSIKTGFTDIRWHQTADKGFVPNDKMKNVFMAVAMDLPDFTSPYTGIHPRDKQDVAARLVRSALAVAYNHPEIVFQGPLPHEYVLYKDIKAIDMFFNIVNETIEVRSKAGFEICCGSTSSSTLCSDTSSDWIPAPVTTSTSTSVTVTWGPVCNNLDAIRYAWRESPCAFKQCAVYLKEAELPMPPFITIFKY